MLELIKKLTEIDGISGRESAVAKFIIEQIKPLVDTVEVDNIGNIIAFKKGEAAPQNKVMVCAHMDEVGFIITDIDESGLLRFQVVGSMINDILPAKQVFVGKNKVTGIIGSKAIHQQDKDERKKVLDVKDLFIDIGANTKEQAEKYVSRGDFVSFASDFVQFGDGYVKAKAVDDRVGCALLLECAKSKLKYDTYFAFTVLEESGAYGARAVSHALQPDIAIVVETTTADDFAESDDNFAICSVKKGAVVPFADGGAFYHKGLYNFVTELADKHQIKWQTKHKILGGTDAGRIKKSAGGSKVIAISLPCRNLHSPSVVFNVNDLECQKNLLLLTLNNIGGNINV